MSKSAARAAVLLFLPTCVFSSKMPSVVSVSSQIKIREHAEALFADDPDMKKLLVTTVVYKAEDLEKDPSLVEAVLRKEYLDEFEQLEANLHVANRLLPKSDTDTRSYDFLVQPFAHASCEQTRGEGEREQRRIEPGGQQRTQRSKREQVSSSAAPWSGLPHRPPS